MKSTYDSSGSEHEARFRYCFYKRGVPVFCIGVSHKGRKQFWIKKNRCVEGILQLKKIAVPPAK